MGVEIDFLPVGDESRGGDAIALRYGNLHGERSEQTVVVIDGGYSASGERLVDHIIEHFGTGHVDIVLSTHPDQDHVSGLEVVLERLSVGQLLMHQPWKHSTEVASARSRAFHSTTLSKKLEESLREASDLEQIAEERGISIVEPFAGMATEDGAFQILGPSLEYYEELLQKIEGGTSAATVAKSALSTLLEAARSALVPESYSHETLRDDGVTSPQNNTSVISLLKFDDKQFLFTADAGISALEQAADRLEQVGFQPGQLQFIQIPHHGSRRNVGPSVLDRLLGPKGHVTTHSTAFVSVPAKNPENKHPARKTLNAFTRRGYGWHDTAGGGKRHHHDAPNRDGWSAAQPGALFTQVEEDSDG